MGIDVTVALKTVTHTCGAFYAVPHWVEAHECPMCARKRSRECDIEIQEKQDTINAKDRTIRSLKGALTKAKRREGAKRCTT